MASTPTDRSAAGAGVVCAGLVHVYRVAGTDVAALRGVDLTVNPGERIALLGPSGSGKSTLLSVVAGLRRPSTGSVIVDGQNVARSSQRQLYAYRAHTAGLMLQGATSNLFLHRSPTENVAFVIKNPAAGNPILDAAGLRKERRPVGQLDRAAQQATALAVAIARRPRLLLVDEPTNQLDRGPREALLDALVETTAAAKTTVLMVTHDEEVAARMQRMVRMREGRVGSEGQRHHQFAVIGADGSIQLPEALLTSWPAGSRVDIEAAAPDRIQITRQPPDSAR